MLDFVIFAVSAILGLVILLVIYYFSKSTSSSSKGTPTSTSPDKAKSVPGWDREPADPEFGDLGQMSKHGSIHGYLLHLHDHGRQSIVMFWWGKQKIVSVCSPEMFKDTMKLTDRPRLLFEFFRPICTERTIQCVNGLDWEIRRKFLYPVFRDEFLEGYIPCFIKIANETANNWSQLPSNGQIELQEEFFMMTIKGITRTCYGEVFESEEEICKMAKSYYSVWNEMEQQLYVGPPEPGSEREKTFDDQLNSMKATIWDVIKSTDDSEQTETPFIKALLQSYESDDQMVSDGLTFMVGGLHTSGYLLVWAIYYMNLYPEVKDKVIQEMKDQVGSNQDWKLKDYVYSTTTYLRQVLDESLRMSTLAPYAARYCDHDIVVGGYCIPAGTPIVLALGVSLKNQCIWKDTEKFDPAHCASGALQGRDSLAFSPFGTGRRKCPAYLFFYIEVSIFLTILLQQFSLEPVGGAKSIGQVHGLVTSPSEKLYCYVQSL